MICMCSGFLGDILDCMYLVNYVSGGVCSLTMMQLQYAFSRVAGPRITWILGSQMFRIQV